MLPAWLERKRELFATGKDVECPFNQLARQHFVKAFDVAL